MLSEFKGKTIGKVWWLTKAKTEIEKDVRLDGIWYSYDSLVAVDKLHLLKDISENNLEVQDVANHDCCDIIKMQGFNKMVQLRDGTICLIEISENKKEEE